MKKYYITPSALRKMINRAHVSKHEFCRQTGMNRGDFYRFDNSKKSLSDKNACRVFSWAKDNDLLDLMPYKNESLLDKVLSWFNK